MAEFMHQLPEELLRQVVEDTNEGGDYLEARILALTELQRRAVGAATVLHTVDMPVVDALEDTEGMINPQHQDSRWLDGGWA